MRIFIYLLLGVGCSARVNSVCHNDDLPLVLLRRDNETGEFEVVETVEENVTDVLENSEPGTGGFRRLQFEDYEDPADSTRGFPTVVEDVGMVRRRRMWIPTRVAQDTRNTYLENQGEDGSGDLLVARACSCFESSQVQNISVAFCPYHMTICREIVHSDGSGTLSVSTECKSPFVLGDETRLAMSLSVVYIVCSLAIVLWAVATHRGRNALSCFPASLCRCWNKRWATYILENHPERANTMIDTHLRFQQQEFERRANLVSRRQGRVRGENGGVPNQATQPSTPGLQQQEDPESNKPTSLVLRTHIWQNSQDPEQEGKQCSSDSDRKDEREPPPQNDEQEEPQTISLHSGEGVGENLECIICMVSLKDGDRVGSLPCQHIFHVDCLKLWLRRCNACPLCKKEKAASPRYDHDIEGTITDGWTAVSGGTTEAHSTSPPIAVLNGNRD